MYTFSGAHALGAAGGVHGDVAAADDRGRLGVQDRRVAFFEISLHEVDTGQIFICRADALERLAGDVHEHRQARAGADEDSLEAHLEQIVDGQDLADDHIGHDLDALRLQLFDLVGNDGLRQTELGDAVDQNAAGGVQRLKQGHLIALLGKQRRAGQAGRAGADDRDLQAVGLGLLRHGVDVLTVPVGDEALKTADGDRLALVAADALDSHCVSCGQTRPDRAGSELCMVMIS